MATTKKTKMISLIVKGKGIAEKLFATRERKINRAVESAKDYALDQILEAENAQLRAIQRMGEVVDNSDALQDAINEYCDALDAAEMWKKKAEQIDKLKDALQEEVPVDSE